MFQMANVAVKTNYFAELLKKYRKYILYLVGIILLIKINKTIFFIVLFTILAFLGKQIRGQFGLKMVVLDPMMFGTIMIAQFLGIKYAIIYAAINTIIVDFITNIASIGTFLNFFLYSISSTVAIFLFGSLDMIIYGNVASLMYSGLYAFFRTTVLPDDPVAVTAKSITSIVFTFLYLTFFGPLFKLIMA